MQRTVFISSTFADFKDYRKVLWETLKAKNFSIRGMEDFGARTTTPHTTCLIEVENSDIYIGVIGFTFGSTEPTTGKSFTQLEYEKAISSSKEILIYFLDEENSRISPKYIDSGENREKLDIFKRTLEEKHTIAKFLNETDLIEKIIRDLTRQFSDIKIDPVIENLESKFEESLLILKNWLLIPDEFNGVTVLITIKIASGFFAASKEVCDLFNFRVGRTVGAIITINKPQEKTLAKMQIDAFIPSSIFLSKNIQPQSTLTCYARLLFSEHAVQKTNAVYRASRRYKNDYFSMHSILGDSIDIAADSCIAIEITEIVSIEKV
jgi:hypothetical protein